MKNKLWSDLKTDKERIEFLQSGRAWETGIIAQIIVKDIIEVFKYRDDKGKKIKYRIVRKGNKEICDSSE